MPEPDIATLPPDSRAHQIAEWSSALVLSLTFAFGPFPVVEVGYGCVAVAVLILREVVTARASMPRTRPVASSVVLAAVWPLLLALLIAWRVHYHRWPWTGQVAG